MVLELNHLGSVESVLFEEDVMPRLELLQISGSCRYLKKISGLAVLTGLKEIKLYHRLSKRVMTMLEERPKHVIVNIVYIHEC